MDSERSIEKQLREYAARRRERQGAPPELHPAARRILQGEVVRTYGKREARDAAEVGWVWPWRKLAWACLIVAVAGGVWLVSVGPRTKSRAPGGTDLLAMHRTTARQPELATNAAEVGFRAGGALAAADLLKDRANPPREPAILSPPAPAPGPQVATLSRVTTSPEATPIGAGAGTSANTRNKAAQNATAMLFYNQAPAVLSNQVNFGAGSNAPAVLVSFHVEQEGETLRIKDADGSIYSGAARPLVTLTSAAAGSDAVPSIRRSRAEQAKTPAQTAAQPVQNYAFEVVGTNRTLKQRVVFNGILLENVAPASNVRTTSNLGTQFRNVQLQNVSNAANNQSVGSNRRISGKAIIGGSQEFPVDALPAP